MDLKEILIRSIGVAIIASLLNFIVTVIAKKKKENPKKEMSDSGVVVERATTPRPAPPINIRKNKSKLTFEEILQRKPLEDKTEVWKHEENGTVRISEEYIDIDNIDVWLIDRSDLFEFVGFE